MKKGVLFLISVLLVPFVSCNDKKAADGKITLTVWESTGGPDEFIKRAGEIYEKSHENIKIKFVNVEVGDAVGQVILDGPAEVGPDVFAAPHDSLGILAIGGHVLASQNPALVKERALASCVKALTYDDVMYGYPVSAETYSLFYNRDLIKDDEVPSSWEELLDWCGKFKEKNPDKFGFMMEVGAGYYTIIFTTSEGNRLFGENGTDREHSNINSEKSVRGMNFFKELRAILNVPASDLDAATLDAAFQSGQVAMYITGLWNVKGFKEAGIDFGVAPLPSLPGNDQPSASFSGTRAMFVSAYSDYPKEASDFAEFLMSDEMQKLRFEITGALPSVKMEVDRPYIKGFLTQLDYAFPMPSIPEMKMYWDAMNSASKNIWDGADVKTELDACNMAIIGK